MSDFGHPHARPSRLIELALWGAAGVLVLSVHIGVAAYLMREPELIASDGAPPAAIMIELAPEPVADQVEENVEAPDEMEAEEVRSETVEPVEEPEPLPEPEPPPPEPVVEETPPEPVEELAETVPEEIPEDVPEPVEQMEPVEEELAALEDVDVPLPVVRPPPPPEKKVETRKPPEKKVVHKPEPKKQPQASTAAQVAQARTTQSDRTAAQRNSSGSSSSSVSPARWQSRVMAHLERRKRYPADSRSRREQGTAYVRFQIDGDGNVLSVSLSRSSGFTALDQEVLAMVRRASPVPAPPPGVNRTIVAPVLFTIR